MDRKPKQEKINELLKKEILAMVDADQKMRKSPEWDPGIDKRNTRRMKEIIEQYGWPGKSLIGRKAADGAWLLVQHTDNDVDFQERVLGLLREAIAAGEAEKMNEAYLTDRIRVNKGQPQVFGTQFWKDQNANFVPRPIENIEHLEERRKEFNLEPFSEYEKRIRKIETG